MTSTFLKLTATTALILGVASLSTASMAQARGMGGEMRPEFSALDANADGFVTTEELTQHHAQRFARVDTNSDGQLSAQEMQEAAAKRIEARITHRIARLDQDGSGTLSQAEIEADKGAKRGGKDPAKRIARLMKKADTDGDGQLSKAEFEAFGAAHRARP